MRAKPPLLRNYKVIVTISILLLAAGRTVAALPDVLELEIVTAPGFVSTPCPPGNQNPTGNSGNTGSNGIDHAAHHPPRGSVPAATTTAPVEQAARAEMAEQLAAADKYISELLQLLESGTK